LLIGRISQGLVFLLDFFTGLLILEKNIDDGWERWMNISSLIRIVNTNLSYSLFIMKTLMMYFAGSFAVISARLLIENWISAPYHLFGSSFFVVFFFVLFFRLAEVASYHKLALQNLGTLYFKDVEKDASLHRLLSAMAYTDLGLVVFGRKLTFGLLGREAYLLAAITAFLVSRATFLL
jgi:hypothetical protein